MKEIELCMKYADTCKRCPQNRICEGEYQREIEQKSGDANGHGDLQILRNSSKGTSMPTQEKPSKGWKHTGGQVQEHKSMGKEKHRDSAER